MASTIEPFSAIINPLPTQKLNIYAFGTGDNAELGLRPEVNAKVVKRPRLNAHLLPNKVGIVAIAVGGMHGLALSYEGRVYSWGVNGQYALGRVTTHTPLTRVVRSGDDDDSDSDEEVPLNPLENTPMLITGFPEGTVITSIAAGDSISIAVTDTGKVYGWGTFRCTGCSIAISMDGQASSWGFNGSYQTGLGPDAGDEIMTPTRIENTATRGVRMTFATAGGQFSILAGVPTEPANSGYSGADTHANDADTNGDEEAAEEDEGGD